MHLLCVSPPLGGSEAAAVLPNRILPTFKKKNNNYIFPQLSQEAPHSVFNCFYYIFSSNNNVSLDKNSVFLLAVVSLFVKSFQTFVTFGFRYVRPVSRPSSLSGGSVRRSARHVHILLLQVTVSTSSGTSGLTFASLEAIVHQPIRPLCHYSVV